MAAAHKHVRRSRERKTTPAVTPTITAGEQRIELQLEGFRSVVSGGFLAQGQCVMRLAKKFDEVLEKLERIAAALETQNTLMLRGNGHGHHQERTGT